MLSNKIYVEGFSYSLLWALKYTIEASFLWEETAKEICRGTAPSMAITIYNSSSIWGFVRIIWIEQLEESISSFLNHTSPVGDHGIVGLFLPFSLDACIDIMMEHIWTNHCLCFATVFYSSKDRGIRHTAKNQSNLGDIWYLTVFPTDIYTFFFIK